MSDLQMSFTLRMQQKSFHQAFRSKIRAFTLDIHPYLKVRLPSASMMSTTALMSALASGLVVDEG